MSDCQVIFWDVYGTLIAAQRGDLQSLINREKELRAAFDLTVRNFGLTVAPEKLHDLFLRGITAETDARKAEGLAHPEVRIDEIWYKLLGKFSREETPTLNFAREVALYFEQHANPKELQPQAFETLTALQQRGIRQGIISNAQFYTPIELSELLRRESECQICTYESIFEPALSFFSFNVGVAKPDLTAFRAAVEILTFANIMPDDCAFVGDSLVNDIAPARHVGFKAVLYAPHGATDTTIKPDLVVHNLLQLLEWL